MAHLNGAHRPKAKGHKQRAGESPMGRLPPQHPIRVRLRRARRVTVAAAVCAASAIAAAGLGATIGPRPWLAALVTFTTLVLVAAVLMRPQNRRRTQGARTAADHKAQERHRAYNAVLNASAAKGKARLS